MTTSTPLTISVVEPLKPAMERMKVLLFNPFNFEKWISIALSAWLAGLAGGCWGFNFNYSAHRKIHNINAVLEHTKGLSFTISLGLFL